jgi:hypothetical protein
LLMLMLQVLAALLAVLHEGGVPAPQLPGPLQKYVIFARCKTMHCCWLTDVHPVADPSQLLLLLQVLCS